MLKYEDIEFRDLGELERWLHLNLRGEEVKREHIKKIIDSYSVKFQGNWYGTKEDLKAWLGQQTLIYHQGILYMFHYSVPCATSCYGRLTKQKTDMFTEEWLSELPLVIDQEYVTLLDVRINRGGLFKTEQGKLIEKIIMERANVQRV